MDVTGLGKFGTGHLGVSPYTRGRRITSLHLPVCPIKSPGTEAGDKTPPRIHLVRHGDSSKTSVSKCAWNDSDGATWASSRSPNKARTRDKCQ